MGNQAKWPKKENLPSKERYQVLSLTQRGKKVEYLPQAFTTFTFPQFPASKRGQSPLRSEVATMQVASIDFSLFAAGMEHNITQLCGGRTSTTPQAIAQPTVNSATQPIPTFFFLPGEKRKKWTRSIPTSILLGSRIFSKIHHLPKFMRCKFTEFLFLLLDIQFEQKKNNLFFCW